MARNAKRSGNPKKRAEALAAATALANPCNRCGKRESSRGGIWCLPCADAARARGSRNRPSQAMLRACLTGVARDLGVIDADGNVIDAV